MTDFEDKPAHSSDSGASFSELLDESGFQETDLAGKVVSGTVVRVERENVFISIGLRSEGIVPLKEFCDEDGNCEVAEGQQVDVLVKTHGRGLPRISKTEADFIREINNLKRMHKNREPVRAKSARKVKGGYECVIENSGIKAFLPASEAQMRKSAHGADKPLEGGFDALVIEAEGRRVVLSRKQLLEKHKAAQVAEFVKKIDVGIEIKGTVSNTIASGAFVDLDGSGVVEGFIPIGEVAWKRVKAPSDVLQPGQEVTVKVINIDGQRIGLSYKQTQPAPWDVFAQQTRQNSRIKGRITNVNKSGVFIRVADGVVGLLRPDNISWKERVNPIDAYGEGSIGKEIEVVMLGCDPAKKKMSLGVKQLQKDPWKSAVKKLEKGETVLTGRVKKESRGGLLLELEDDIEGFIRFSDLSDSDRELGFYKTGMEITGVVKSLDNETHTVSLSAVLLNRKNEREMLEQFNSTHSEGQAPKLGDLMSAKIGSDEKKQ